MPIALYPGTFDPVTNGHIDIAERASGIFRKVIAVVADNPHKSCLFSTDERVEMLSSSLERFKNIEVIKYSGLVANCLDEHKASVIIRGLRALSDFDYEFQMAFTNRELNEKAETVFLMPNSKYTYLSSTMVRQLAKFDGDISAFVPRNVGDHLKEKLLAL